MGVGCTKKCKVRWWVISVGAKNSVVHRMKGVRHCYFIAGCQAIAHVETYGSKDERFWNMRNTV